MQQITITLPAYLAKYHHSTSGRQIAISTIKTMGAAIKWAPAQLNLFVPHKEPRSIPHLEVVIPIPNAAPGTKPMLTRASQKKIERNIAEQFITQLDGWVQAHAIPGTHENGIIKTIESFFDAHGIIIEEDITTDCIKQMYFRYRRQNNLVEQVVG